MSNFSNPNDYYWKPIYFDLTELLNFTTKNTNLYDYNREKNGVKWHVWYDNGWHVEVEKNGVTKATSWVGYEPRLGVDVSDTQQIEETLEKGNYIQLVLFS